LGLSGFFKAVVCGEDVAHGKPDPEVFLLAARKLNADPDRAVVFEDAHGFSELSLTDIVQLFTPRSQQQR
jgi:hypothetical protein